MKQIINLEFLLSQFPEMLFYLYLCDFSSSSSGKIIFQAAAILNCVIWRHHWELALAPGRFGQSISKITSVPIFMLLYKFAHSLMRIPLTALTRLRVTANSAVMLWAWRCKCRCMIGHHSVVSSRRIRECRTFPLPDISPTAYLMPPDNSPPATNDM